MKFYGKKSFSFEFANDDDKAQALEIGNFYIASQPFIVRPWKLFIEADLKNLDTLPIWALFKDIPEELRDADGYSRLASEIGTPLYTDRKTELKGGDYARICIDVKASSKFPTVVPVVVDKVKVFKVAVTYNWKPPKCPHCLIFGHDENNCPKHRQVKPITVWVSKEKAPSNTSTNVERVQLEETGSQEQGNQEKGIKPGEGKSAEVMEISEDGEVVGITYMAPEGREKAQKQHEEVMEEDLQEKVDNGETTTTTDIASPPPQTNSNKREMDLVRDVVVSTIAPMTTIPAEGAAIQVTNGFHFLGVNEEVPEGLKKVIDNANLVTTRMNAFLEQNKGNSGYQASSSVDRGRQIASGVRGRPRGSSLAREDSLGLRRSKRDPSTPVRLSSWFLTF
ncbi:hypothetical protein ACHQM5_020829 [Ranunculus cassubicifolius]